MFRKSFYCISLVGLLLTGTFSLQAQDLETCDFPVNEEASVFDDLQTVTDSGIAAEDVQAIASQIRGNEEADFEQLLIAQGYSPEEVQAFLANEDNYNSLYNIVSPSPSRTILERAYALLASYGLPSGALTELYPLTSDFDTLYNALLARGLSPEQAEALANEGLNLVSEAVAAGVFDYTPTLEGENVFDEYGYEPQLLYAVGDELGDEAALAQELLLQGIDEVDADAMAEDLTALGSEIGLTEHTVNGLLLDVSMYQAEYYGLPENTVETLSSQENEEAFRDCLEEAGLDAFAVDAALTGFGDILYNAEDQDGSDEVGEYLDSETIEDVVYYEMADLLSDYGLTTDDLSEMWDVSDDTEVLNDLLLSYGFSEEEADIFIGDFTDSAFGEFVDDLDQEALDELDDSFLEVEEDDAAFDEDDLGEEDEVTDDDVDQDGTGDEAVDQDADADEETAQDDASDEEINQDETEDGSTPDGDTGGEESSDQGDQ